ncbi:MAG: ABC transporter substrate-binding protein, partial [Burkholderiaceae bacterium]
LKPDLVLAFSDLQADIVAELIRRGVDVHAFNQRDITGILAMIRTLGALVGASEKADALAQQLAARVENVRANAPRLRPRVYFEEWDEPMISGIGWVSELIAAAGGDDVFANLAGNKTAKNRIVSAQDVIAAAPDIIIGSWCGKKFQPDSLRMRAGWETIPALQNNMVFEIKSPDILSPGPSVITEGLQQVSDMIERWQATQQTT